MTDDTAPQRTTLVLGGTGKTGRRVAERLRARALPTRVGSRAGAPPFDWTDPATWTPALRGAGSVYLAYQPDLAVPSAVDTIRAFAEQAVRQGCGRVVLLSGRGEESAQACEQVVRDCGAQWTILRASWFCQNFSEGYLRDSVCAGEVILPAGDVGEPFVDADDIADVAVAALTDDRHVGRVYEVTGPRLLTFAEAVAEIAKASGRDVRYTRVTVAEYAAALAAFDVPADYQWLLNYLFTTVLDGRNASLGDGVRQALGRDPRDFTDYARDADAAGAWADTPAG
ncbi:MAG TPA: NmrA family NAD(P)-binding protein [Micromonosporaceae bacterium]|nr:NmrA family NAD(P)-binding protein [Micromonosporaceae bacterium]